MKLMMQMEERPKQKLAIMHLYVPVPPGYESGLVLGTGGRENLVTVLLRAHGRSNKIHCSGFYVLAKQWPQLSSGEEREAFRGVGRTILCYGISVLAPMLKDLGSATFSLAAGGAQCLQYKAWRKPKLYYVLHKYKATFHKVKHLFHGNDNLDQLRELACLVEDNEKLVRYYNSYGLRATDAWTEEDNEGLHIEMTAKLADVMEACQNDRVGRLDSSQREVIDRAIAPAI
eukprot:jgi/Mesvir1/24178/Mv10895-RA.1